MKQCFSMIGSGLAALGFIASSSVAAQSIGPLPISRADLETKAREACRGDVVLKPGAIRIADIDGDERTDVLFNWAEVTCASGGLGSQGAGFCGMHNCSIDVYLSSQYKPGGWPKPILNHREIAPQLLSPGDRALLRTAYQGGSCDFAQVCQREWRWDGSQLVSRELTADDHAEVPPAETMLEITRANVAGTWVDFQDGCATDAVLSFQADGRYASYEQNGDWRLLGNRIAVTVRETYMMGDAGSTKRISDPEPVMLEVMQLGTATMTLKTPAGQVEKYRRCG